MDSEADRAIRLIEVNASGSIYILIIQNMCLAKKEKLSLVKFKDPLLSSLSQACTEPENHIYSTV